MNSLPRTGRACSSSAAAARRNLEAGAEGPAAPLELAAIAAVEARTAEAMDWLERSYRAGWNDARVLELDPFFDPVRQEPRYRAVLDSMREETAAMRKRRALVASTPSAPSS